MHPTHAVEGAAPPYWPEGQAVQTADVSAAATSLYAPALQAVHALVPELSVLYVPPRQAVHEAGLVEPEFTSKMGYTESV